MHKKYPIVSVLIVLALATGTMFSFPSASLGIGDTVKYSGQICACKNSNGVCYEGMKGAYCNHNIITNWGKNSTRDYLSVAGTRTAFNVLALSNSSVDIPTTDSRNFTIELTGGLARATGTVTNYQSGNWSILKTFTADGTFMSVNTTGVFNNTVAGTGVMFAGGTFTAVNLESADTLTINYTFST